MAEEQGVVQVTDKTGALPETWVRCPNCGSEVLFLEGERFSNCFGSDAGEDCGRIVQRLTRGPTPLA